MKLPTRQLIEIVKSGGTVKTGIDVYSEKGVLLIEKDTRIKEVKSLQRIIAEGLTEVPFDPVSEGGLWDHSGKPIKLSLQEKVTKQASQPSHFSGLQNRIKQIAETKKLSAEKHARAKRCIQKVIGDIQKTGGEFDYHEVERTVSELLDFLTENENSFSFLTNEIFSYDDYLYNHSINVCTIATAALQKFNGAFSKAVSDMLDQRLFENLRSSSPKPKASFSLFTKSEIKNISTGFFLHDVGKVLLPESILKKKGYLHQRNGTWCGVIPMKQAWGF